MAPDGHAAGENSAGHTLPVRLRRRLRRSLGPSSMGRAALIQSTKAAVAALLAWIIAAEIFHFSQPFLAPWSAIFIVAATVYRSVCSAAQQFSAAVVAVVLAGVANELIPWELVTMFVAVLVGLLIGQWRWFGDSGTWIGITALLILTSGAMQESMLIERLIETAIGAAIGILVNATISPPVYQLSAGDATTRVSDNLANVLDDMAATATDGNPESLDVSRRAREAIALMRHAEQAVTLDDESRRLNHRPRARRPDGPGHERTLACLRHTWSYVEALGQALQSAPAASAQFDPESRERLSAMFEHIARLVRLRSDTSATEADIERTAHRAMEAVESVERAIGRSAVPTEQTVAILPITTPARHSIRELSFT